MKRQDKARTFCIKGVFKIATRWADHRRRTECVYESRIIVVEAKRERDARSRAHAIFEADQWRAHGPAPDIATQSQTYVGISCVLQLGGEMGACEVWYEFSDQRPSIEEPSPARSERRRGPTARTRPSRRSEGKP